VQDLGIEKFKQLVLEERKILSYDPRWTSYIQDASKSQETPLRLSGIWPAADSEDFKRWLKSNTRPQKQAGYVTVTIALPLGDITADQVRALADIVRQYTRETARTTVEQNIVIRWVSLADLPALYSALKAVKLNAPGAGALVDIVTCPGTDTCKLGISSSRGLAGELRNRINNDQFSKDEAVQNLHIKISGCFNSCGQHHVSDLGFYGVSRKVGGFAVPHFQVVLGGEWENNAGTYGVPVAAVPSKNIPQVITRLTEKYVAERQVDEKFKDFVKRLGKVQLKSLLEDLTKPPANDRSFFSDWGDPRTYGLGDMGTGECAGEVITPVDFGLAAAERELFDAQVSFEKGDPALAGNQAYRSMLIGAQALVKSERLDVSDDPEEILTEFRTRFYDTQKFWDPFAGGKFASYLFDAHTNIGKPFTEESSRLLMDEAQLFIDAAHSCSAKLGRLVRVQ
jgi:sulfite reductase (ferredoxin)